MSNGKRVAQSSGNGKKIALIVLCTAAVIFSAFALKKLLSGGDNPPVISSEGTSVTEQVSASTAPTEDASAAEREALLLEAEALEKGYFYDEAIALINSRPELSDESTVSAISQLEKAKASLVKFEGEAKHIFFHSLIVYPELAFDNKGSPAEGYNMWMVTANEFKQMLPLLYNEGYVLYNIDDLAVKGENGMEPADIMLPPGKKPLILSVDDVNYYEYMKPDGFADRLDVNADGELINIVIDPEGNEYESFEGDVMPIVDQFVKEHPDFSYRGAKGIVAITGYQGAFGYRIVKQPEGEELDARRAKVTEIADCLRRSGWQIACHSYTHNGYFQDGSVTLDEMKSDLDRWNERIRPWIGESHIYISAFGVSFKSDDPRYRYIIDNGFDIFCPVDSNMPMTYNSDNFTSARLNIDGFTMIKYPQRISKHFFDPALVLDPSRPELS